MKRELEAVDLSSAFEITLRAEAVGGAEAIDRAEDGVSLFVKGSEANGEVAAGLIVEVA